VALRGVREVAEFRRAGRAAERGLEEDVHLPVHGGRIEAQRAVVEAYGLDRDAGDPLSQVGTAHDERPRSDLDRGVRAEVGVEPGQRHGVHPRPAVHRRWAELWAGLHVEQVVAAVAVQSSSRAESRHERVVAGQQVGHQRFARALHGGGVERRQRHLDAGDAVAGDDLVPRHMDPGDRASRRPPGRVEREARPGEGGAAHEGAGAHHDLRRAAADSRVVWSSGLQDGQAVEQAPQCRGVSVPDRSHAASSADRMGLTVAETRRPRTE
jgi:hypothetical protein